jgi:hypothetical protein
MELGMEEVWLEDEWMEVAAVAVVGWGGRRDLREVREWA